MNDLISSGQTMLPETLEDLTQFVLVGKAKVQAYKDNSYLDEEGEDE